MEQQKLSYEVSTTINTISIRFIELIFIWIFQKMKNRDREQRNWLPDEENELHWGAMRDQAQPNLIPPQTGDWWGEIKGRQSEELRTSEDLIFNFLEK